MKLFKYVSKDTIEKIIDNCSLRFTQPCQLNDPFEMYPIFDDNEINNDEIGILVKNDIIHFYNTINNFNYLGLCMSSNKNSIIMWSHYASEHSGVMLEFNLNSNFFTVGKGLLYKVPYSHKRQMNVSIDIIEKLANNLATSEDINKYCNSVFTKASCWKYEKEFRFIKPVSELEKTDGTKCYYDVDFTGLKMLLETMDKKLREKFCDTFVKKLEQDTIKAVYFGVNTSEELKNQFVMDLRKKVLM